MFDNILLN